jgi:hypothetical protein
VADLAVAVITAVPEVPVQLGREMQVAITLATTLAAEVAGQVVQAL